MLLYLFVNLPHAVCLESRGATSFAYYILPNGKKRYRHNNIIIALDLYSMLQHCTRCIDDYHGRAWRSGGQGS